MARNKLIAKYAALNNEKLPQRIYDKIKSFIESEGIEELPFRELSGRWTGKLDISNGGWRNDFDLLCPVLAMCRVNRHGEVLPDMAKINACVLEWVNYLTMPTEDDQYLGASDETFSDSDYLPDDINEFQSAAYAAEIKSFLNSEEKDFLQHDKALSEIDAIGCAETDNEESDGSLFEQGFNVTRIDNAEDFKKIMESLEQEASEGGGISWTSPEFNMEELEELFDRQEKSHQRWMDFIDDLRNGRFGDLPEDYDGLVAPDDISPNLN